MSQGFPRHPVPAIPDRGAGPGHGGRGNYDSINLAGFNRTRDPGLVSQAKQGEPGVPHREHEQGGQLKTISQRRLGELLAAFIDQPEGLPGIDPEGQSRFIEEYLRAGAPEFKTAFKASSLSLRALSLLMKGKSFSRLDPRQREDLINRLLSSRNPLLRGAVTLLALLLFISYYRRAEVAVPLGFDSRALREEAALRVVRRDRDLPPKQEGEA